jgi:hypothetical protein
MLVLLLTRLVDQSNQCPKPVRPVLGCAGSELGQTGFCVDSCPFILLCDNCYHVHNVFYLWHFHTFFAPNELRDIGGAPYSY